MPEVVVLGVCVSLPVCLSRYLILCLSLGLPSIYDDNVSVKVFLFCVTAHSSRSSRLFLQLDGTATEARDAAYIPPIIVFSDP